MSKVGMLFHFHRLCFCFVLPVGRSGKPTYFSAVFNTLSPAIKQSWISNLQMAKLALGMFTAWSYKLLVSQCDFWILSLSKQITFKNSLHAAHYWINKTFVCVCICYNRRGQSAGLVLCRRWCKSDQKAETPSAASTNARGHVKTTGVQGEMIFSETNWISMFKPMSHSSGRSVGGGVVSVLGVAG